MKKKAIKTASQLFLLILLWGCKETPPAIDFSEKVIGLVDTTYITSTIPTPVNKIIFVEDLTGVNCNNCPKAAAKIREIADANPGKVVALADYPWALTGFMKPWPGFDTLNTIEADNIFAQIYGSPSAIPTGGVNRKIFAGETTVNNSYNKWSGFADIIKAEESPVIIKGEIIKYDSVTRKCKILVKVQFTKAYAESVNLALYLTESKILSKQLMPDGSLKNDYEHNHALRKAVTTFNGLSLNINASTIGNYEAGRTFEKEFEVVVSKKWKKENCAFVILVNRFDTDSKEVIQAAELDLK